jgi:replicative DNA helicase
MRLENGYLKERVLLSSVIRDGEEGGGLADQMISSLTEESFTSSDRRYIFNSIKAIRQMRQKLDYDMLRAYTLENESQLNEMGSDMFSELSELMVCATQPKIDFLIKDVADYHKARKLITLSQTTIMKFEGQFEVEEALLEVNKNYSNIFNESSGGDDGKFIGEYLGGFFDNLKKSTEEDRIVGMPLGIPTLDNNMGGLRGGETLVIAALPSMGKTSWMLSIVINAVLKGFAPAIFSIEMPKDELIGRMLPMYAKAIGLGGLKYSQIRNPKFLGKKGFAILASVAQKLKDAPIYINDNGRSTVESMRSQCFRLKAEGKLGLICVDYLQLMVVNKNNTKEELEHITGELKLMAKEFDVPVIMLSQFNKRDTSAGRPNMGWLKGSGAIEANADAIFFSWREYAITREGDPSEMAILMGKGRGFDSSDVPAIFCTDTLLITEKSEQCQISNNMEIF